ETDMTLGAMNNLATGYKRTGRIKEAEEMYLQLIPMAKEFYRNQHPSIPIALNNLAGLYRRSGRRDEARKLYEESLTRREKNYGDNHPGLSLALSNLAGFYKEEGEIEKAIAHYKRAIRISKEFHGKEHPYVVDNLARLAKIYSNLGRFEDAGVYLAELSDIVIEAFGDNHIRTARMERTIAYYYRKKKEIDKADLHYRRAMDISHRILPENDSGKYIYVYSLARFLQGHGREKDAERYFMECLDLVSKNPGKLKKRREALYKYISLLYEQLNLPEEAQKFKSVLAEINGE
ncbi:MAG: tetratricopeptide repeat protein, partial [Calditrichota bacterium]